MPTELLLIRSTKTLSTTFNDLQTETSLRPILQWETLWDSHINLSSQKTFDKPVLDMGKTWDNLNNFNNDHLSLDKLLQLSTICPLPQHSSVSQYTSLLISSLSRVRSNQDPSLRVFCLTQVLVLESRSELAVVFMIFLSNPLPFLNPSPLLAFLPSKTFNLASCNSTWPNDSRQKCFPQNFMSHQIMTDMILLQTPWTTVSLCQLLLLKWLFSRKPRSFQILLKTLLCCSLWLWCKWLQFKLKTIQWWEKLDQVCLGMIRLLLFLKLSLLQSHKLLYWRRLKIHLFNNKRRWLKICKTHFSIIKVWFLKLISNNLKFNPPWMFLHQFHLKLRSPLHFQRNNPLLPLPKCCNLLKTLKKFCKSNKHSLLLLHNQNLFQLRRIQNSRNQN